MMRLNDLLVGPVARLPWRVETKLLAAFLAIVALLIALGAIGLYELKEARPLANRIERLTNELVNKAEADVVADIEASGEAYRTSLAIVIGFALAAIALALVLGRTISLSLIGPIREIDTRLDEIASGDSRSG
jgi:methyl-accepting chemotaxis protein